MFQFGVELFAARFQFQTAMLVEDDAILGAVQLESGLAEEILVLAELGVEGIRFLAELPLLEFLRADGLGLLRFAGGEFTEKMGEPRYRASARGFPRSGALWKPGA